MAKANHICMQGILLFSININLSCDAQENNYHPGQPIVFSSNNPASNTSTAPAQSPPQNPKISPQPSPQNTVTFPIETHYAKPSFSSNVINDPARNNGYGQFSRGYTAGSQFRGGTTAGSHFAADPNNLGGSYRGFSPPPLNYVSMPNGSYRPNGPSVGQKQALKIEQATPKLSGDILQFVLENPPIVLDGNIENLLPAELHAKAYGKSTIRK